MGEIKEAHEKGYKLVLPDGKEMNGPGFYRIDFMNQIFFLLERAMWLDRDLIICECGDCSDDGFHSCFDGGMVKMIEICEDYRKKTGLTIFDLINQRYTQEYERGEIGDFYYLHKQNDLPKSKERLVDIPFTFPSGMELAHPDTATGEFDISKNNPDQTEI